ncbi:hemerythrin domain-containing protein [Moheibacter lacus]|uniref:Hemerythrin domain-containing protein n=1 Tax=Moheibacter lacus TaxID=2745851 RepID=A0A838ZJ42_9FLAO|nr:hemerythrin domain-containing protein [Moheibacter lacus]MBA5628374.1 hemerythrin domain-containing protein [Moheibacter lacus]
MSEKKKPIKRHPALQQFSREHHFGLLLCWKIREGFRREIEAERMKKYTDWFFQTHLKPHFEAEEKYMFTLLSDEDKLKKRAIKEHRRLERLFEENEDVKRSLSLIEEELEQHIRFEERSLFGEIQKVATEEELEAIEKMHQELLVDDWEDEFWK